MEVTYGGQKYSAQFSTRVLQGKWGGEGGLAAGWSGGAVRVGRLGLGGGGMV